MDNGIVYVLGAGFSRGAGVPLQSEILDVVDSLGLSVPPIAVQEQYLDAKALAGGFMKRVFQVARQPTLEDVFTLLDQAIQRRQYCAGYSWQSLVDVRLALTRLIVISFLDRQGRMEAATLRKYSDIASVISDSALRDGSHVTVISLNWDCVFEKALATVRPGRPTAYAVCCPSAIQIGNMGHSPLRGDVSPDRMCVLKLHGSVDWFSCPGCGCLFCGPGVSEAVLSEHAMNHPCPACREAGAGSEKGHNSEPSLEPFIVSPTFLKGLDGPRISLLWHWAHLALRAARRIVFVGYSLPSADFVFRTLLKRAIAAHASIDVVLRDADDYTSDTPSGIRHMFPVERYRCFFGVSSRVSFHLCGLENYPWGHE